MSVTMMHFAGFMLNNSVYILLLYLFLSKMSTPRFGRTMTVLQFVGALALCQTFNMIQIAPINLAIHLGSVLTLSLFTFRNEVKKGLLYGLFYTLISVIAELLSVSALMMVLGGKITETALEAHNMLIINFVNCLICYVFYMAIMAMIARKDAIVVHLSELLMFTFTAVLEMFVAIEYAQNIAKRSDGVKLLLILIGFLALDIYFIITISRIADSYQTRYDNSLLHKQNEIQLAHYVELEKNYAESRKVIHDIKKHLAILSELKSEDPTKAEQYRRLIEQDVDSLAGGFTCSNRILAIVMGQKIAAAEAAGIKVSTDIEDISFDFMNDLDITAIFANLWDNAIEACENVTSKWIKVSSEQRGGFILITFKNSSDGQTQKNGKVFRSTKTGHSGVGLTIIRTTVEKYGGITDLHSEAAEFSAELTIPLPLDK